MKTEIIAAQKLNFKNATVRLVVCFFAGFGLYHFVKAISNLL